MGQFLGPETDRMCQFLGPETDIMGERYYIDSLPVSLPIEFCLALVDVVEPVSYHLAGGGLHHPLLGVVELHRGQPGGVESLVP